MTTSCLQHGPDVQHRWTVVNRGCTFRMPNGELCRASAMRGQRFCYLHDPESADDAAEARRLGGFRRRRERTLGVAYEIGGIRTAEDLLRIVEIALFDLLGAEASITRARALLHAALVGTKVLETGDLEARVAQLEAARDAGNA